MNKNTDNNYDKASPVNSVREDVSGLANQAYEEKPMMGALAFRPASSSLSGHPIYDLIGQAVRQALRAAGVQPSRYDTVADADPHFHFTLSMNAPLYGLLRYEMVTVIGPVVMGMEMTLNVLGCATVTVCGGLHAYDRDGQCLNEEFALALADKIRDDQQVIASLHQREANMRERLATATRNADYFQAKLADGAKELEYLQGQHGALERRLLHLQRKKKKPVVKKKR